MSSRRRPRPGSAPIRSASSTPQQTGRSGGGGSGGRPGSASTGRCGFDAPTFSSLHKENRAPPGQGGVTISRSSDMVRAHGQPRGGGLRARPRPGRPGSRTIDESTERNMVTLRTINPKKERHPLDGWVERPKHASGGSLWLSRWSSAQPHPSFDIDGDGVVSNEDLLIAREFDMDGNGVLDSDERRTLRRSLAKTGLETYYSLPHGPPMPKVAKQPSTSLHLPTPRDSDPRVGIDADSQTWHIKMDRLTSQNRSLAKYSSQRVKHLLEHADMDPKPVNMIRDLLAEKQGLKAEGNARISAYGKTPRSARSPRTRHREKLKGIFDAIDEDHSGYLDRAELGNLAERAGRHLTDRQLDDAMQHMDADNSGEVEFEEFVDWWEHGKVEPPQGSVVFQRITEQVERKVRDVRTLFRKFDENCDGTVSHKEFRDGLSLQLGINLTDSEFKELMQTIDEDNSNEIDYNEFAASGMLGSKLFAARTSNSGCSTRLELLEKRK
jgi:Ca2+-binding EF-hand superfamily protein